MGSHEARQVYGHRAKYWANRASHLVDRQLAAKYRGIAPPGQVEIPVLKIPCLALVVKTGLVLVVP